MDANAQLLNNGLGSRPVLVSAGRWVRLTQPLFDGRAAPGPAGRAQITSCVDDAYTALRIRVTTLEVPVHAGTHVDAPSHFFPNGKHIDEYPLDTFLGPGVALDLRREGPEAIQARHLDRYRHLVRCGDIVLLSFGYGDRYEQAQYREHPYLSESAAQWLVERGVKMVGVDSPSPDQPRSQRDASFDFPAHRTLLGAGVLIIENLSGAVASLCGHRLEVVAVPLTIRHSDGAPCAPIARIAEA